MNKMMKGFLALTLAAGLVGCSSGGGASSSPSYSVYLDGFDWGSGVSKVYVTLGEEVDSVDPADFTVTENGQGTDFTDEKFPVVDTTSERVVTDAYLTDEAGEKTDGASKYVTLELECTPATSSPVYFSIQNGGYNQYAEKYNMEIKYKDTTISGDYEKMTTAADMFTTSEYKAEDGTTYPYASYTPEEKSDVLVVWLHGGGEGGSATLKDATDMNIPLLAAEVTAFVGDDFKSSVGDVNILVPQCPTCWLDMEGSNPPMVAEYTVNTGKSYYTESLHEMINSYKEEIGAEKVILTGCSNGGYMVMQLGVEYPEEYDGLVMSSEAMLDKNITDEQIEAIKSVPMFFIFAENDPTIDPTLTAEPTIKRLQDAGADHLSVSKTADVHDLSGKWMDDGQPHQYSGHWSWVYLFNNESVDENGVTVFDWMGSLVK